MKFRILTLFLAALALAPFSEAATVRFLPELPETNVFLQNPVIGSSGSAIGYTSTANRWGGFSFSPDSDVLLGQISIYVSSRSSSLGNKVISVQVVSLDSLGATPTLSDPDTILHSERGLFPAEGLPDTTFAYMTLDLDQPVSLSKGSFYGVIVNFVPEPENNTNGVSLRFATASSSMKGGIGASFLSDDAGSTFTMGTVSYTFALATPIPEPHSAAMLGMLAPCVAIGYLARRRMR